MSASLLQKSLKLTEDNKGLKKKSVKKKKSALQHCKWRTTTLNSSAAREKQTKESILSNIKTLEELDAPISIEIAEKIFSRKNKIELPVETKSTQDEKTVFTEKDFEEFEKEYFAS